MGRPLNKKYFGNRNIGSTSTTADDGIGGLGVASITLAGANNSTGFSAGASQISIAAPIIANGVQATAALVVGPAGALLTMAAKTSGTNVTTIGSLTGTAVATTATYTSVPQKSSNGSGTGATFIVIRTGGTNYNANTVVTANAKGAGYASGNTVTISGANLGGVDGTNDLTITLGGSVAAAGTITGFTITEGGSGYTTTPAVTLSTGTQGTLTATTVLTVDTGAVGSSTYQENAIIAYAYISGALVEVDIQKQQSSKRYRVNKSGDTGVYEHVGTRMARLRFSGEADGTAGYTAEEGVELNIVAFDQAGGTYLVKKLTAHKAVVVPTAITRLSSSAGSQFPLVNGLAQTVPWTFATPTINYNVQIENA